MKSNKGKLPCKQTPRLCLRGNGAFQESVETFDKEECAEGAKGDGGNAEGKARVAGRDGCPWPHNGFKVCRGRRTVVDRVLHHKE